MTGHRPFQELHDKMSPEAQTRAEGEAKRMSSEINRDLEARWDLKVASLKEYANECGEDALSSFEESVLWAAGRIAELDQQVKNLEEYVLKGVAFRDELQADLSALRARCEDVERIAIKLFLNDRRYAGKY